MNHKFSAIQDVKTKFFLAERYKTIVEDNIECFFSPDIDIAFHIILTVMVTNYSTELSFTLLKYIKNPNRTAMQEGRLNILSLLSMEADVGSKISFGDLTKF